jgi:lauroyl/myristoyl acyltransferase
VSLSTLKGALETSAELAFFATPLRRLYLGGLRAIPTSGFRAGAIAFARSEDALRHPSASRRARREAERVFASVGLSEDAGARHADYARHVWAADMGTLLLHLHNDAFCERALSIASRQALDEALGEGRGAIVAGLHMGPHLGLPLTLAQLGYEIGVIGAPDAIALGERFGRACLPEATSRITWLPTGDPSSLLRARSMLRSGRIVLGFVDQIVPRSEKTEDVALLGKTVSTSSVLSRLASLTGASLISAHMSSAKGARFSLVLGDAIPAPERDAKSITVATQALFDIAAARIRERPEQWLGWQQFAAVPDHEASPIGARGRSTSAAPLPA